MQISIMAVGRMRAGPERELVETYLRRIPWPVTITEVEERRPIKGAERIRSEADLLIKALPASSPLVVLDERGKTLTSPEFAEKLGQWQDQGDNRIAFAIGGADGLDKALHDRAALAISFGRMTWPHMMVRAMLAEQIYRATTILTGHPYHK